MKKTFFLIALLLSFMTLQSPIMAQQFGLGKQTPKGQSEEEIAAKKAKEAREERRRLKKEATEAKKKEKEEKKRLAQEAAEKKVIQEKALKEAKLQQKKERLEMLRLEMPELLQNRTLELDLLPTVLDEANLKEYLQNLNTCKVQLANFNQMTVFFVKDITEMPTLTKATIEKRNVWMGIIPETATLESKMAKKKFINLNSSPTNDNDKDLNDDNDDKKEEIITKKEEIDEKPASDVEKFVSVKVIYQRKVGTGAVMLNLYVDNKPPQIQVVAFNTRFFGYILSQIENERLCFINDQGKSFYFPKGAAVELLVPAKEINTDK